MKMKGKPLSKVGMQTKTAAVTTTAVSIYACRAHAPAASRKMSTPNTNATPKEPDRKNDLIKCFGGVVGATTFAVLPTRSALNSWQCWPPRSTACTSIDGSQFLRLKNLNLPYSAAPSENIMAARAAQIYYFARDVAS